MKKLAMVLLFLPLLSGCLTYTTHNFHTTMVQPVKSENSSFSDPDIDANFTVGSTGVALQILNKTEKSIKISWDEVAYIDPSGRSMRVIHNGVRLIDRNAPQAPSLIPPKARFSDAVTPADNIYYISGQYGGWNEMELFPGKDKNIYVNTEFGLFLPLEINGSKKEYNFRLKINKVEQIEQQI